MKYVQVEYDEDLEPGVTDGVEVNEFYLNKLCTYKVKDNIYTISPLTTDVVNEKGKVVSEALATDIEVLGTSEDEGKADDQIYAADLGDTITKIAGSRYDIGFTRSVDFKSYTKIIIRIYDEDDDEYKFVEYDASSFNKSLKDGVELENMQAIISNNADSESRENLVLLYAETTDLAFAGKVEKNAYRIVSNVDVGEDEEGEWRYWYEVYNPYTGAKETDVPSADHADDVDDLEAELAKGTMIELVDGMVDADYVVENDNDDVVVIDTATGDNLVWIAEVDEAEGYFVVAAYDDSKTDKDEIEEYVENYEGSVYDIYGNEIEAKYIDYDKNTVVSVMTYKSLSSMWNWGTMSTSNMAAVASAKKDLLCYNEYAVDRNGKFVTKYADYVKAYISVDTDVDEDENPMAEFIIVIVNADENAALDA